MWEFGLCHKITGEETTIYGYTFADAVRRWEVNLEEYDYVYSVYID